MPSVCGGDRLRRLRRGRIQTESKRLPHPSMSPARATVITAAVALILATAIYVLIDERAPPSPGERTGEPVAMMQSNSRVSVRAERAR